MLVHHERISREEALGQARALLHQVGIPAVERQLERLPASALGRHAAARYYRHGPLLPAGALIADEPTTALDVTIQAQILELLDEIAADPTRAIIFISHDFGVIARMCDEVVVMFHGQVVEAGPVARVLAAPEHPYTRALLGAIPRPGQRGQRLATVEDQIGNSRLSGAGT